MTRRLLLLRRAVVGLLLAVLALSLWGTELASADDSAAIDHAQPTDGAVRLLVSVPGSDEVDLSAVTVTIGGKDAKSEASAASRSSVVERTSVLAIDTSDSMAGTRLREAKKAASTYLRTAPANVKVGVLTFDRRVKLVVAPSLDRKAAQAAVAGLRVSSRTALYDGVLGALEAAGPGGSKAGQRKILLLSDGKDTTNTPLSDVLAAIKKSGAGVDVVSLQKGDEGNRPLNEIASAGKGTMLAAADPAALTAAFAKEADVLARQLVVTAQLPAGSDATSSDVTVTVPTSAETFTAAAYVPVRTAAKAPSTCPPLSCTAVSAPWRSVSSAWWQPLPWVDPPRPPTSRWPSRSGPTE
jgi:tight adherence protein B